MRATRRGLVIGAALTIAGGHGLARADHASTDGSSTDQGSAPIVVGSKIDVEGDLLGTMILLALKDVGLATVDRLSLGPTAIVRRALLAGAIDIYPEYTGNAAFFFHREGDPAWKNAAEGFELAARLDRAANDLVWLAPAPADNTWVIAVPQAIAAARSLRTMGDFARWAEAGGVKLAASAEFVESPAGLPAFEAAYGFRLDAEALLVLSGGETAATMKAASAHISGVDAAMAYATDGAMVALGLVAMRDDKHAEPVYAPAPVVRGAALARHPVIAQALRPVFAGLDLETLRRLNARVAVDGADATRVAADYLAALHRG